MSALILALALLLPSADEKAQVAAYVDKVRETAKSGSYANLKTLFTSPNATKYLESMVGPQMSLRKVGITAFPAPPGFEKFGDYWLTFHRYQEIESDHDVVVPIVRTGDGFALGNELPEDLATGYKFEHIKFKVNLLADKAEIQATCDVKRTGEDGTLLMRMNDGYTVSAAKYSGAVVDVMSAEDLRKVSLDPRKSQLVRGGGILYLTKAGQGGKLELVYSASLDIRGLDKTTRDFALLTSYWYPHIGRQPVSCDTEIQGPKDWLLLGNGNRVSEFVGAERKVVKFKSEVPLSWFHVVGGPYKLASEVKDRGRTFRAWHLEVDAVRGKHDADMARDAVAYYEDRLGRFPYSGYDVVDTPDFYGVECYSFTVLTPRITSWATSHEVGHTYFGGMVPNTYIKGIWNEGLTQYIDSAGFKKNSDRSLDHGYQSRKAPVSLSDSFLAHGPYGNVGYMRGAYVFKMLENELGMDQMNLCLRRLILDRQGKSTEWSDLEKSFGTTAGKSLGWFFDQWVRGKAFPAVVIERGFTEPGPRGGFNTHLELRQEGTPSPFKLRMELILTGPDGESRKVVAFEARGGVFDIETPQRPTRVAVNAFGYTLADVPPPYILNGENLARR